MNAAYKLTILVVLCFGSTGLAQQNQEELKQRLLAQAQSIGPDDYAFTRTVRVDQTSNGKTEQKVMVERFDPTKSADARWTLISTDGAPPSVDALTHFRKESLKRRVGGYFRLAGYFGTPATVSTDSRGRTTFHFAALPKDTVFVLDSDVSQNATVEASVGQANGVAFVEQVRTTVKPTRIKLIAKLDAYESVSRYRIGPEGKPLMVEQTTDVSGSGMGQRGKIHTVINYSDYRAVSRPR